MVELDHSFTSGKPIEETWEAILDLDRLIPCVEGGLDAQTVYRD